ncbi:MAG: hypothetical protein Q4E75_06645 [bacterium]|nr:hypothetical protein [bacterium]
MRCSKCGNLIDDGEVLCQDCKLDLKKSSSRKEVRQLEELIEENKKLNDLEITKELPDLEILQEKNDDDLIDDTNIIEDDKPNTREDRLEKKLINEEVLQEDEKKLTSESEESGFEDLKPKKGKKKIVIIIILICLVLVIGILSFVFLFNKKDKKIEEEKIDYEVVINEYGKSLENILKTYLKDNNNSLPSFDVVSANSNYKKHDVVCSIHNLYNDGSVYLDKCLVDGKKVNYSYGVLKEEQKDKIKIEIYKNQDEYSSSNTGSKVGEVICITDNCKYIKAFDKYVILNENNSYYLYNYLTDELVFGPFNVDSRYTNYEYALSYNNVLYGIYHNDGNTNNIYSLLTSKNFKGLKGSLTVEEFLYNPKVLYKYGYVVLKNGSSNNFVNLKTGNVSYTIEGEISNFIEDEKVVYILNSVGNNKYRIYNSNGKELFDGIEVNSFKNFKDIIIISTGTKYKIYDKNLNLKLSSKKYDKVLGIYEDFEVVLDEGYLKIIDSKDSELAKFEEKWDDKKYRFHESISGWYTENGKNGIYLVIENKNIPYGTDGSGIEFYYIPSTKEQGTILTKGVGGYAKPVLYLYPEEKTNISVKFSRPDLLTTTYPKFKDSWSVVAYPNGDLYDSNGKYYYALYWEEEKNHTVDFSYGFYVTDKSAISFLEDKLSIIGLNDKEKNEFIMYWLPILEKNKKSLVYFELTEERNKYNNLIINPVPDSILRVAMHVKKTNKKTSIKEQVLTSFNRIGFTAVEWGGVVY